MAICNLESKERQYLLSLKKLESPWEATGMNPVQRLKKLESDDPPLKAMGAAEVSTYSRKIELAYQSDLFSYMFFPRSHAIGQGSWH